MRKPFFPFQHESCSKKKTANKKTKSAFHCSTIQVGSFVVLRIGLLSFCWFALKGNYDMLTHFSWCYSHEHFICFFRVSFVRNICCTTQPTSLNAITPERIVLFAAIIFTNPNCVWQTKLLSKQKTKHKTEEVIQRSVFSSFNIYQMKWTNCRIWLVDRLLHFIFSLLIFASEIVFPKNSHSNSESIFSHLIKLYHLQRL